MFKVSGYQVDHLSTAAEDDFVGRLSQHLERNCPNAGLPSEPEARIAFTRECIASARSVGLTWERTIAEHARLATLRGAGDPVVDPDLFAGDDPTLADTRFSEEMRRSDLLHRGEGG